jgi:hypothetical protein
MYLYVNHKGNSFPTKFTEIEQYIQDSHNEIFYTMGENYIYRKIGPHRKYYYPNKDWVYNLYINNLMIHFKSENNFNKELTKLLSQMLIPFIYDDGDDDDKLEQTDIDQI